MADKEATHCDLLHPSKYLRAADLLGRDVVVTIASVKREELTMTGGAKEVKPIMKFVGKEKALVLNSTNKKIIKRLYGPYTVDWVGKAITLYGDPTIKFGPELTGGLRVRPTVPSASKARESDPTGDGPPPDDDIPDFNGALR